MQRLITFFLILTFAAPVLHGAWWWPFGNDKNLVPAEIQTAEAKPYYEKAVEANSKGRLRRAAKNFEKVWEDYPGSDYAAESLFRYGEIKFNKKDWKNAYIAFYKLLQVYPDSPHFNQVVLYQFKVALANADGNGVRWAWIIPFRAYERAVTYFEVLIANAPYNDLAPLALMNVAKIHKHLGNTLENIDALDRLINLYPSSVLADDAYLQLAETYSNLADGALYDQGSTREAISYFQDFLVLFPSNEGVAKGEAGLNEMRNLHAKSRLVIGEYYYLHRNWYIAAEIFFNDAITIAPESESANLARLYLARIDEFKVKAAADPNYQPPRNTWGDLIFFWRERQSDLTRIDADAAAAKANAETSPASGNITTE